MILRMPKIGMEMTEAVLAHWLAEDGSTVAAGQPIYALETDKVEHEVEAPTAGVLRHLGTEGETYEVGAPVAEVVEG